MFCALARAAAAGMPDAHDGQISEAGGFTNAQRQIKVLKVQEITRVESGNLLYGRAAAKHETAADDWDTLAWRRVT